MPNRARTVALEISRTSGAKRTPQNSAAGTLFSSSQFSSSWPRPSCGWSGVRPSYLASLKIDSHSWVDGIPALIADRGIDKGRAVQFKAASATRVNVSENMQPQFLQPEEEKDDMGWAVRARGARLPTYDYQS
jgi:hypothetical protein